MARPVFTGVYESFWLASLPCLVTISCTHTLTFSAMISLCSTPGSIISDGYRGGQGARCRQLTEAKGMRDTAFVDFHHRWFPILCIASHSIQNERTPSFDEFVPRLIRDEFVLLATLVAPRHSAYGG